MGKAKVRRCNHSPQIALELHQFSSSNDKFSGWRSAEHILLALSRRILCLKRNVPGSVVCTGHLAADEIQVINAGEQKQASEAATIRGGLVAVNSVPGSVNLRAIHYAVRPGGRLVSVTAAHGSVNLRAIHYAVRPGGRLVSVTAAPGSVNLRAIHYAVSPREIIRPGGVQSLHGRWSTYVPYTTQSDPGGRLVTVTAAHGSSDPGGRLVTVTAAHGSVNLRAIHYAVRPGREISYSHCSTGSGRSTYVPYTTQSDPGGRLVTVTAAHGSLNLRAIHYAVRPGGRLVTVTAAPESSDPGGRLVTATAAPGLVNLRAIHYLVRPGREISYSHCSTRSDPGGRLVTVTAAPGLVNLRVIPCVLCQQLDIPGDSRHSSRLMCLLAMGIVITWAEQFGRANHQLYRVATGCGCTWLTCGSERLQLNWVVCNNLLTITSFIMSRITLLKVEWVVNLGNRSVHVNFPPVFLSRDSPCYGRGINFSVYTICTTNLFGTERRSTIVLQCEPARGISGNLEDELANAIDCLSHLHSEHIVHYYTLVITQLLCRAIFSHHMLIENSKYYTSAGTGDENCDWLELDQSAINMATLSQKHLTKRCLERRSEQLLGSKVGLPPDRRGQKENLTSPVCRRPNDLAPAQKTQPVRQSYLDSKNVLILIEAQEVAHIEHPRIRRRLHLGRSRCRAAASTL
ncbi:hypothetical protein J6590_068588 [Homalodisca vitripennis]|nr:hypothetical protein J6590_068588 [Homalodisca vitripennis]